MIGWSRERIAWTVSGASFAALVALLLVALSGMVSVSLLVPIVALALILVWLAGMIVAITFSEEGWLVKGTSLEWAVAFIMNPVLTLILYHASGRQVEEDAIDLDDRERLSRL